MLLLSVLVFPHVTKFSHCVCVCVCVCVCGVCVCVCVCVYFTKVDYFVKCVVHLMSFVALWVLGQIV
jgi:hypothetical protein